MDGNTLQTHPDDSSLFLCLVTGLTDAPRSLQTDTWRRTWAPLTGSCRDSTVLTRGVILDPQVSAWPGVAVPGNVMFKFFFFVFFLTSPNRLKDQDAAPLPGLLTTPSSFYCYTQWLDVRVCLSLCWKAAPRFHSDLKWSDQADSKYSWWQTGVAKWNLVGRLDMDINVCTNVWGTLGSPNSTTKCNSIS